MASYVDLAAGGTGHTGTTGDPFSWSDFYAAVLAKTDSIFYIKGQTSSPSVWLAWPGDISGFQFSAWGNDPFRIQTSDSGGQFYGNWNRCIIEFTGTLGGRRIISFDTFIGKNVFIKSTQSIYYFYFGDNCYFYGCTLVGTQAIGQITGTLTCQDTQLDFASGWVFYNPD